MLKVKPVQEAPTTKHFEPHTSFTSNQGGLILKSSLKLIAFVACIASLAVTHQSIEAQEGGSNGGMVAVLDVAQVFEKNTTFIARMDAIKKEAEQFKASMEQKQAALQQEAEPLKTYQPGSPEFNQLQGQLEQKTAALRTEAQQTNNELLNREAQIYYDTYSQMQQAVAKLAGQYNISLILRFDSKPIDRTNRGEVVKGVNRNVVYHKDLDLTGYVIKEMETLSSAGVGNLNQNR